MTFPGMRAGQRGAALLPLLFVLGATSCGIDEVFACQENAACERGSEGGTCESTGYCSFPDPACDSGQRYGELAGGGFSGRCVDPSTGTTTTGDPLFTTTTSSPPTTSGPEETSLDPDTTSASDPLTDGLSSTSSTTSCPQWWDCSWGRRRTFTIPPLDLAEDVAGFPVPLTLEDDIDLTAVRILGPGRETWPHERESDTLWVRVPVLPADAELTATLYYDNPDAEDSADAGAVWDDAYLAVWHMSDTLDVSGMGHDTTASNVEYMPGIAGAASVFDGTTSQLTLPATAVLADLLVTGFTVSAWVLVTEPNSYPRLVDKSDVATSTRGWSLLLDHTAAPPQLRFDVGFLQGEQRNSAPIPEPKGWNHVAVSAVLGDLSMVINGEPVRVASTAWPDEPPGTDAELTGAVGARNTMVPVNVLSGALDEVRISGVRRSPSWIAATFRTSQPGAILLGPEEHAPTE